MYLQRLLGFKAPRYAHVPVATDAQGQKLSKSQGAAVLDVNAVSCELARALSFLGHSVPGSLTNAPVEDLLQWARGRWSMDRVPAVCACAVC
jgi:glutamyl-Q tRNA(Asp) synthetase